MKPGSLVLMREANSTTRPHNMLLKLAPENSTGPWVIIAVVIAYVCYLVVLN